MIDPTSPPTTSATCTFPITDGDAQTPPPPASLDHGRFHSLGYRLGRGLYGDVWLYADRLAGDVDGGERSDERVAVKETRLCIAQQALALHPDRLDNPHRERAVVVEVAHHGGHAHVLGIRRQFCQDGSWFLVTELCAGRDLLRRLDAAPDHRMTEPAALACVGQIARGLHFLHQVVGVAHRDLSLENVLEHRGIYKIADFGLAVPAMSRCRGCVGKAYYMAPEVVASEDETGPHVATDDHSVSSTPMGEDQGDVDSENERDDCQMGAVGSYDPKAADMWSLGIVLFVLLTGSPLVTYASPREPSYRALEHFGVERILEAWGLRDDLSEGTIALLVKILQVEPRERPTIAQILAHPALATLEPL